MTASAARVTTGAPNLRLVRPATEPVPRLTDWPESERHLLARELHDFVSYTIAAISLQAGAGLHALADAPDQASASLQAIRAASKDAMRELRTILGRLLDAERDCDQVEIPLAHRLAYLVEMTTGAGVATRLHVSGSPRPVPAVTATALYRVAQESLTNVLRHSGATCAEVELSYGEEGLSVEITDDGVGAADPADSPGSGLGIAGMRQRVERLGGLLDAAHRELLGFRVRAWLPDPSGT